MYLTAQRVRAPDGRQGINAYLHWHGKGGHTGPSWRDTAGRHLGVPSAIHGPIEQVPPGGNSVRSYLDIFAPDGATPTEVTGALLQLLANLEPKSLPARGSVGRVQFEFGMERALAGAWKAEVQHLYHACLQVWTRTRS